MRSAMLGFTTFAIFALLPLAAAQAPAPQQASLEVGRVTIAAIKGEVAVHAVDGALLSSSRGQVLVPGMVVETKKGSVVLDLADGSQAQVKSNTRVVLKDPAQQGLFSLELFLGKVVTKIKKRLGSEPSFRMGTPTAVITVRGTEFLTDVDKKGKTEVYVYEGVVEVAGLLPGSRSVLVRPGFWTDVLPHRPPREPSPIDRDQPMLRSSQGDDRPGGTLPSEPTGSSQSQRGSDRTDSGDRQQQPSQPSSGEKEKPD